METQAAFAEGWKAEFLTKMARTANWLLHQPEVLPQTYQRTVPLWEANRNKKKFGLVGGYTEMDINWNHPRMREALRIYYADKMRFDDTVNLNQEDVPDHIDIDPDLWKEVSQILKQLRYRDVSVNFGMSKYCPQFSSMSIDKETSTDCPMYKGARGPIARIHALVYQELAAQYGTEEEPMQTNSTGFGRVVSPRINKSQAINYHDYAKSMFPKSIAETYPDLALQHNMDEKDQQGKRHGPGFNGVVSPLVKDSQALYYQQYARRVFPKSMNQSPAEIYRDLALQYSVDEDYQLPRSLDIDKANAHAFKEVRHVGLEIRKPCLIPVIQNPLSISLIHGTKIQLSDDQAAVQSRTQDQFLEEYFIPREGEIKETDQRMYATNLQTELREERVSEQNVANCTSSQSSSTSVLGANQFYFAVLKGKEEHRGLVQKENITPPTSHRQTDSTKNFDPPPKVQRRREERGSDRSDDNHVTQDIHTPVRDHGDTEEWDSPLPKEHSVHSEISDNHTVKETIQGQKPKQRNRLLRFIQRQASNLRFKIKSFSCCSKT